MRDDFDIEDIHVIKLALNHAQTQQFDLPPALDAKTNSPQYQKFLDNYGSNNVWELEAMPPELLERTVSEGIEQGIDSGLLDQELRRERLDQHKLKLIRDQVIESIKSCDLDDME